jgi:sulfur carrier protein ThiS
MLAKAIFDWYRTRRRKISAPAHLNPKKPRAVTGETMQITIKLFATFRVGRFAASTSRFPAGTTIADILVELNIPEAQVGMLMLNHVHAEPHQQLKEGDTLSIFPLVGGG